MYGESLGVMMNVVTAAAAPFANLKICVGACHLRIAIRSWRLCQRLAALVR